MTWINNWLSNFKPLDEPFDYYGIKFHTVENFFQAMKSDKDDIETRQWIASLSPSEAKKAGRKIKLRADWEQIKLGVMEYGLRKKFAPGTTWHKRLMETGNEEIIEWNNWGDRYWGRDIKTGFGDNHLGLLLMKLREEYRNT
jgi:ribA/ribD-fused uncharacterized protein